MAAMNYPPCQPPLPPPPAGATLSSPLPVISPHYCAPYPVDLVISRKSFSLGEGNFGITDVNGNVLFKVKGKLFSIRDRRVLRDAADNPIVSFQQKILTAHRRWKVFRGDSSSDKDLLFSVKKSSLIQFTTKLDVCLASNGKEECDYRIEGSWYESSCTIYQGKSSNIVAQMHRKHNLQSVFLGKDTFSVTVYPFVDYAFIASLVVILEEINADRSGED